MLLNLLAPFASPFVVRLVDYRADKDALESVTVVSNNLFGFAGVNAS